MKTLPFAVMIASVPTALNAQAVDCDRLLHTKMPFELKMHNDLGHDYVVQVYRSDALYRVVLTKSNEGQVTKSTFQANFVKSMRFPTGKTFELTWNVPTDKFFYDQGLTKATGTSTMDGKNSTPIENDFSLLGDAVLTVGPCAVNTKHYVVTYGRDKGVVKTEMWQSPDLEVALKMVTTIVGPQNKTVTVTAVDLATVFAPLH